MLPLDYVLEIDHLFTLKKIKKNIREIREIGKTGKCSDVWNDEKNNSKKRNKNGFIEEITRNERGK